MGSSLDQLIMNVATGDTELPVVNCVVCSVRATDQELGFQNIVLGLCYTIWRHWVHVMNYYAPYNVATRNTEVAPSISSNHLIAD